MVARRGGAAAVVADALAGRRTRGGGVVELRWRRENDGGGWMRPRGGSRVAEVQWCSLHLRVDGEGDCGGCLMVVRERRCWMREDGTVVVFRDGGAKARRWCCVRW